MKIQKISILPLFNMKRKEMNCMKGKLSLMSYSLLVVLASFSYLSEDELFNAFHVYGVPNIEQSGPYWCGPASLCMVLNYWGYEINQSVIASHIYDSASNLTFIRNMTNFPTELGFQTEAIFPSNLTNLKRRISDGIPVVILQRFSVNWSYGHFRVVIGYNDKESIIILNDPILGENQSVSYQEFTALWQPEANSTFSVNNWTLTVTPKNNVLKNLMKVHQFSLNSISAERSDWEIARMETVISWVVGFATAIVVMVLTDLYREKRRDKREKLVVLKKIQFFLDHYRDRFRIIQESLFRNEVQTAWKGNLQWYSDEIQQKVTETYDEGLLDDSAYESFLDFTRRLHDYSMDIRGFVAPAEVHQLIDKGKELLKTNEGLADEIFRTRKAIKKTRIWRVIPY